MARNIGMVLDFTEDKIDKLQCMLYNFIPLSLNADTRKFNNTEYTTLLPNIIIINISSFMVAVFQNSYT